MKNPSRSLQTSLAGLGVVAMLASPGLAAGSTDGAETGTVVQLAHMGQGQGIKSDGSPCQTGMPGPGLMPQGMGGQGMMGTGIMGRGMVAPGMRGPGTMDNGAGILPEFSGKVVPSRDLTIEDVRHFLEHRIEVQGNERLKVGKVEQKDENTISADITTIDDSLVKAIEVDRHTGQMRNVN